jgi:hypothetical protein
MHFQPCGIRCAGLNQPMPSECPCRHCNGIIEFESDQAGQTVACPHCGMNTQLFVVPMPTPESTPTPARARTAPKSRLTVREAVLANTQYSNGRSVVNWSCGLVTVASALCLIGLIANGSGLPSDSGVIAFFTIIGCLLSAWIVWGIAHAIYDIADCALRRFNLDDDDES